MTGTIAFTISYAGLDPCNTDSASAQITANIGSDGTCVATDISGTWTSSLFGATADYAICGLEQSGSAGDNDNCLYPGTDGYSGGGLDYNGITFSVVVNGTKYDVNIYNWGDGKYVETVYCGRDILCDGFVGFKERECSCFGHGTLIRTPDGDRAVEDLAPGDLVLTAQGSALPVRWVGRSVVSSLFGDPLRILPVRIRAGALGVNLPVRDLLLSPNHGVHLGDSLVQAGALVNGTSIVRVRDMPIVFTYWHLELDTHALVLAEGVAAESFLDGVEEIGFQNWDERSAPVAVRELPYPRVKSARQVPAALRRQIAAREASLFGDVADAA